MSPRSFTPPVATLVALLFPLLASTLSAQPRPDRRMSVDTAYKVDTTEIRTIIREEPPESDDFVPYIEREAQWSREELQRRIVYPEAARNAGIQGSVIVRALIGKRGEVIRTVVDQSDNKMLEMAAVRAVQNTAFTPARNSSREPVASWVQVNVEFRLEGGVTPPQRPAQSSNDRFVSIRGLSAAVTLTLLGPERNGTPESLGKWVSPACDIRHLEQVLERRAVEGGVKQEGVVWLSALISRTGDIIQTSVDSSDGRELNMLAFRAVADAVFTPARDTANRPTSCWVRLEMRFTLAERQEDVFADVKEISVSEYGRQQERRAERSSSSRSVDRTSRTTRTRAYDQEFGRMTMRMEINGVTMEALYHWDDYGERSSTETVTDLGGDVPMTTRSISQNGYTTTIITDAMGSRGTRRRRQRSSYGGGVAPDLAMAIATLRNTAPPGILKTLPERTILGLPAEGVAMDSMGVSFTIWTSGNLLLACDITVPPMNGNQGVSMHSEVTSLDFKTPIPTGTFDVPKDVEIVEEETPASSTRRSGGR